MGNYHWTKHSVGQNWTKDTILSLLLFQVTGLSRVYLYMGGNKFHGFASNREIHTPAKFSRPRVLPFFLIQWKFYDFICQKFITNLRSYLTTTWNTTAEHVSKEIFRNLTPTIRGCPQNKIRLTFHTVVKDHINSSEFFLANISRWI